MGVPTAANAVFINADLIVALCPVTLLTGFRKPKTLQVEVEKGQAFIDSQDIMSHLEYQLKEDSLLLARFQECSCPHDRSAGVCQHLGTLIAVCLFPRTEDY